MTVLAGLSNSVMAEWTKVDWTDEYTNYVDLATIQVNGYRVKMWHLVDYKTVQKFNKGGFLSIKSQYEYDCQEAQTRGLATTAYSGNMGYGQVIGNDYTQYPWHPVQPGSVKEDNFKIACKK